MPGAWVRTEDGLPCPICGGGKDGKQGWCLLHIDGKKVICPRVKSTTKIKSGYIHKVHDNGLLGTKRAIKRRSNRRVNWCNLNRMYIQKVPDLSVLSRKLNLSIQTLQKFSVGWDGEAWTIPSYNGYREMIGIQRRFPDGKKLWVTRSAGDGLFIPNMESIEGNVFITEGWTDAGVLVDYGFRAVGRTNWETGGDHLKDFLKENPNLARVTLVGDNDTDNPHGNVGRKGVEKIARELYGRIEVGVLEVPPAYKDMRQWSNGRKLDANTIVMRCRVL